MSQRPAKPREWQWEDLEERLGRMPSGLPGIERSLGVEWRTAAGEPSWEVIAALVKVIRGLKVRIEALERRP